MSAGLTTASVRIGGTQASAVIAAWPAGRPFSVEAVLAERPELSSRQSILIDLAYEEFCRLEESGHKVSAATFIERFPQIERPLLRVLQLHELCNNSPEVRDVLLGERWPAAGEELCGYRLVEEIGRGAASRVFVAEDLELAGRRVVVKVGRGSQEAAALGALQHPNIVPVLAARTDEASGLSVLCMPSLGRATLAAVIDQLFEKDAPRKAGDFANALHAASGEAELPSDGAVRGTFAATVARIGSDLASALAYAHRRGIVHSDVKPANVLLADRGTPMLLDFNLARREGEEQAWNRGGTLPYMAPEQLARWQDTASATPESDLFSLGVTLYELLAGRLPFGPLEPGDLTAAAQELAQRHKRGFEPLPAARLQGNLQLGELIHACLAKDPSDRPTAEQLSEALAATLRSRAVAGQTLRIHRRAALVALAAGIGLATTGAGVLAVRTPAVDREWAAGLAAADSGRFDEAIAHFDFVLGERPDDPDALVARGWSLLHTDDADRAVDDLRAAYDRRPSGETAALLGYAALNSTGDPGYAKLNFWKAVQHGFDSPAVRNNTGYCELQTGNFDAASVNLRTALRIDPSCGAALHNLALLDLREAVAKRRMPETAIIERALKVCTPSPNLFLDAACVYAAACEQGAAEFEDAIRNCCESAVALGANRTECLMTVRSYYPAFDGEARTDEPSRPPGGQSNRGRVSTRFLLPVQNLRRALAATDRR